MKRYSELNEHDLAAVAGGDAGGDDPLRDLAQAEATAFAHGEGANS